MKALTSLISSICTPISMHNARKETLSAMILAAMDVGNVHHVDLARYLPTETVEGSLQRVWRFFKKQKLELADVALVIVDALKFKGKFDLCLDRTNWKFGKKDINYLVLSWRVNKWMSVPLLAVELDKAGNSNAQERIDLLALFHKLFGFDRIKSLTADREFVGEKWFKQLIEWGAPFYIRVKENGLVPYGGDETINLKALFDHLAPGCYRKVEKEMYGTTVYFAGTRADAGDLVIVMSNQNLNAKAILDKYRMRWSIEEMFRKFKTSGFHWENTHMTDPARLLKLLGVLSIASVLIYSLGIGSKVAWKKTLNCPVWSTFRSGLIRFQHKLAKGAEIATAFLANNLENLGQLVSIQK